MLSWITKRKKKTADEEPIKIFAQKKIKKIRGTIRGYTEFECNKIIVEKKEFNLKNSIAQKQFNEIPLSKYIKKHKKTRCFLLEWLGKTNYNLPAKEVFKLFARNEQFSIQKKKFIELLTEDIIINEFYEREKGTKGVRYESYDN